MATSQANYQIRGDDTVSANSNAGWAAALNTPATIHAETQFGIRFELEETAGVSTGSVQYKLQYRHQPVGGSFTAWTDMRVEVNISENDSVTSRICVGLSASSSTDGTATSNVLNGSARAFVAGSFETGGSGKASATALTSAVTLNNQHTEFEFRCRIHKFSDNRVEVKQGDVFEFRLVTSAGATLTTYTRTPSITVGSSPGIIGGCWAESPNRIGPWQDANGTLYWLGEWAVTWNDFILVQSTDGGNTWTNTTTVNAPPAAIDDIESADARLINHVLHIAIQGPSSDDVWYLKYHTSSHPTTPNTWQINNELVTATGNPQDQNANLEVRSDGSIVFAYCEVATQDHAAYRIRNANGTYQSPVIINIGDGKTYNHIVSVKEATTDTVWFFYWSTDGVISYRRLLANNSLTEQQTLATGLLNSSPHRNPTMPPLSYVSGGQQIVAVAWKNATDRIEFKQFTAGSPGSTVTAVNVAVARGAGTNHQPHAGWALDGTTLHMIFADFATNDIWHTKRDHGGSWSTPVEIIDGVTAHWIRAEKVTGGIGVCWDNGSDGGTGFTRYHLHQLAGAGPGSEDLTVTASAVVSVTDTVDSSTSLNWYPGYYVLVHAQESAAFKQSVVDNPLTNPFTGYQIRYMWVDCESTQGNYTNGFNEVDADLARVAAKGGGKKLGIVLQSKTFDDTPAVPLYIRTQTAYRSTSGAFTGEVIFDGDTHRAMLWKPSVNTRHNAWVTAMVNHIAASPHAGLVSAIVFEETSLGDPETNMSTLLAADYSAAAYISAIQSNLLTVLAVTERFPAFYYHQGGFSNSDGTPYREAGTNKSANQVMGEWLTTHPLTGAGTPDSKPLQPHSTDYVLRRAEWQGKIGSMPNVQANDYGTARTPSLAASLDYMLNPAPTGLHGHFAIFSYASTSTSPAYTFADVSAYLSGNPRSTNLGIPQGWLSATDPVTGFPSTTAPTVTQSTTNVSVKTVTIPAHAAGDILLLVHGWHGPNGGVVSGITSVNGVSWTTRHSSGDGQSISEPALSISWLRATSAQGTPTSVTVTQSGTGRSITHVHRIAGAHATAAPAFAYANINSATWDPAPLDPPAWGNAKTLWLVAAVADADLGNETITSGPAGYTPAITNMLLGAGNGINLITAWRELEASSEDPGVGTNSSAEQTLVYTIAVRSSAATSASETVTVNASATITVDDTHVGGTNVYVEDRTVTATAIVSALDSASGGSEEFTLPVSAVVSVADVLVPSGETTWMQLLGDDTTRIEIPHLRPPAQAWSVAADNPWVSQRQFPLGLVGEQVTDQWTLETMWSYFERPAADAFVAMIKKAAAAADARLLVNIAAPHGGTAEMFVGEVQQISQQFSAGMSTVSLTVTRVDATPVFTGPYTYAELADVFIGGAVTVTVTDDINIPGALNEDVTITPVTVTITVDDDHTLAPVSFPEDVTVEIAATVTVSETSGAPLALRQFTPPITVSEALARADVTDVNGTFTTRYTSTTSTPNHTFDMRDAVFEGYFDHDAAYEKGSFASGGFPQIAATGTLYESTGNSTTHVVNCPAHNSGDRLLLMMCFDGSAHTVDSISTVGGQAWTLVRSEVNNARTSVYEIVQRSGSGSSQNVTITLSASEAGAAAILRITGANATQAAEASGTTSTSATPNPTTTTPSWEAANNLWIAIAGYDDGTLTLDAPPPSYTGFTTARANLAAGAGLGWAYRERNASSENPSTFTLSASEQWMALCVVIRSTGGTTPHQKNTSVARLGESARPNGIAVIGGKAYGTQPTTLTWERMKNGQQVQNDVDSWISTGVPSNPYVNQTTNQDGDSLRLFVAQNNGWGFVAGRRSYNTMDGMQIDGLDATGSTGAGRVYYENCWIRRSRDDGIESDDMNGVHLWDCFIDGGFSVVSVSPGTTAPRGTTQSPHDVTIESCVIHLAALPGGHKMHSSDTTNGKVFKTESNGPADANGNSWGYSPRLVIRDTIIASERWAVPSRSRLPIRTNIGGVSGRNDTYENVTLCWLGTGSYPGNVPTGCTLLTGTAAANKIAAAEADWKTRHGVTNFDTVNQAQMLAPTPPSVP